MRPVEKWREKLRAQNQVRLNLRVKLDFFFQASEVSGLPREGAILLHYTVQEVPTFRDFSYQSVIMK
jgi:hypothetical protein